MAKLVEIGIDLVFALPNEKVVDLHRDHQARMDTRLGVWRIEYAAQRAGGEPPSDDHPGRPGRLPGGKLSAAEREMLRLRTKRSDKALALRAGGSSMSAIARELDVSRQRVYQILGRLYVITKEDAQRELDARAARAATPHDEKILEVLAHKETP